MTLKATERDSEAFKREGTLMAGSNVIGPMI